MRLASITTKGRAILEFKHIRHKPPQQLHAKRKLLIACSPLRTHANLSAIIRTAGCCAVPDIIATGNVRLVDRIARDGAKSVRITIKSSLPPALRKLKREGYTLVGLEQTTNSTPISEYAFPSKTAIIVGAEREGLSADCLALLDAVVEIPVWGLPCSHNVATAASMAIYEYCRQFPDG
jgi:tRNA G18 (ribose-2'-O)-methylase SpoU